ncbi:MAG: valine--tRNA ligase [Candidatus Kerfeldbacteria bacterium]|nr:valine--tRNA ligase [Candidatus Kerfeldbacteria bacterium]
MPDLPKGYIGKDVEPEILKRWEESGYANPDNLPNAGGREPYSIAMPPPNATGFLHIGHAVMVAIQDLLIRFERMRGKKTLWLPGTDHAAIATQNMVEKELKKEGKRRQDLGREAFLKRVDEYVAKSQHTITRQIRSMGASCDWSRERFTLDKGLSGAVNEAFKRLYDAGLIYRGNRIVNWCPRDRSTLADDEVEYVEKKSPFYYLRYGPVVIGTARPETKFGDKVIVVHPDDKRYQDLIGKTMTVDWILGPIEARVIADPAADPELGSGAMTITPAHSFVDFELAKKYGIAIQKIIDEDGKLTDAAGPMQGMPVKEAREKVVAILKEKGLLERIDENYTHNLSVCYRCGTPVEPLPSEQWFVAVDKSVKFPDGTTKTLKERSLEVVRDGSIRIIPKQFEKTYYRWMENLHDWCISRQIWYGHRVPVWRKGEEIAVGRPPKGDGWTQDPDTLDTWFSSGLWTFSTLGWPKKTKDLKNFHPTDVMETAYDILFFWVARMILMSTYLVGEIPFKTVYLHGLVRDKQGRKMSKSLGNGIDPLEMAEKYGADAVRLSLIIGTSPGNDQRLAEDKIAGFRNYANKIWNIGRFVLMYPPTSPLVKGGGSLADRWIQSRLATFIKETTAHLEKFEFSQAGEKLYDFAWHEFADWYLEIAKVEGNHSLAREVFESILKLLHPFMPFVTEALWEHIKGKRDLLMIQDWPKADDKAIDEDAEKEFAKLQERITALRVQRKDAGLTGKTPLEIKPTDFDREHHAIIERLAMVKLVN